MGALSPEGLRLAAYLGDPVAREALGSTLDPLWTTFSTTTYQSRVWLAGLEPWGKETLIRAALVAVRSWIQLVASQCSYGCATQTLASVEEALTAWILEASPDHAKVAGRLSVAVNWLSEDCVPRRVQRMISQCLEATACWNPVISVSTVIKALSSADSVPYWASNRAAKRAGIGCGRLRHAIREQLVPWALGVGDPLRPQEDGDRVRTER